MKIIFGIDFISRKNTGISALVENLSVKLIKQGHSVFIAAIEDQYSQSDKDKFADTELLLVNHKNGPIGLYNTFKSYLEFYTKSDADIAHIHSFWSISTVAIYFWALTNKKAFIISTNGMMNDWALSQSGLKKKIFLSLIFKKVLNNAKAVIINSKSERLYLEGKGWNKNLFVIPNGVNIPSFEQEFATNTSNKKALLFLSRIHEKKGIELLLNAWSEVYQETQENNWQLFVVGFLDPEKNAYEKYIAGKIKSEPGLSNVYMSEGKFGHEMWDQYYASDAFILPTFSEGSAMVVLNAWTAGKLCLTTIESNLEIGLDKRCTILIEPEIDSIKNGILKLMNLSDAQIIKFGQVGKKIVQENYTWQKIATKHIEIYRDAITKQFG